MSEQDTKPADPAVAQATDDIDAQLDEALKRIHAVYGNNLDAFFRDAQTASKKAVQPRRGEPHIVLDAAQKDTIAMMARITALEEQFNRALDLLEKSRARTERLFDRAEKAEAKLAATEEALAQVRREGGN